MKILLEAKGTDDGEQRTELYLTVYSAVSLDRRYSSSRYAR